MLNTRILGVFYSFEAFSPLNWLSFNWMPNCISYRISLTRDWKLKYTVMNYCGKAPYKAKVKLITMRKSRSPKSVACSQSDVAPKQGAMGEWDSF